MIQDGDTTGLPTPHTRRPSGLKTSSQPPGPPRETWRSCRRRGQETRAEPIAPRVEQVETRAEPIATRAE